MSRLRIATFNANSIRSRLEIILAWMLRQDCDVLLVQETKVTDDQFPLDPIRLAGLHCVFTGQKSYNGVAIISRRPLQDVKIGLGGDLPDEEARVIRGAIDGVTVVNTYVPQGTDTTSPRFQYKLAFIRQMREYFSRDFSPSDPIVWGGDFNVARDPIDVYDPERLLGSVCYHPEEHKALDYVKDWGFVDLLRRHHPEETLFTFWDYRVPSAYKRKLGWRIDHLWATQPMADNCTDCWVDVEPRLLEKPSDHTFLVADFEA